ncbi:unnamed protein product, partial [Effrenium voratum]
STVLLAPVSSTLKPLATALTASPHPKIERAIIITQVFAMPPSAGSHIIAAVNHGFVCAASLLRWVRCPCIGHARKLSDELYLTLTLKKCSCGSPLLPQSRNACIKKKEDWSRLPYEEFELTRYLQPPSST